MSETKSVGVEQLKPWTEAPEKYVDSDGRPYLECWCDGKRIAVGPENTIRSLIAAHNAALPVHKKGDMPFNKMMDLITKPAEVDHRSETPDSTGPSENEQTGLAHELVFVLSQDGFTESWSDTDKDDAEKLIAAFLRKTCRYRLSRRRSKPFNSACLLVRQKNLE